MLVGTGRARRTACPARPARVGRPGHPLPLAASLALAIALALGLTAAGALRPGAALASCAIPPDLSVAIPSGDVVVVGTVERVENNGRWASVRVEERWYGADAVPDTVQVRGGPEPGAATGNDRTFTAGTRYLFVSGAGDGVLVESVCTVTQPWSDALAQYRPPGVEPVVSGQPEPATPLLPPGAIPALALIGALAIAVVSYRFILVARKRPPDWMR